MATRPNDKRTRSRGLEPGNDVRGWQDTPVDLGGRSSWENSNEVDYSECSPQEIRRDIDRTRADLDDTIDELQYRLTPSTLTRRAMSALRDKSGDAAKATGKKVWEVARSNPVATGLILSGIGMMLFKREGDGRDELGYSSTHKASWASRFLNRRNRARNFGAGAGFEPSGSYQSRYQAGYGGESGGVSAGAGAGVDEYSTQGQQRGESIKQRIGETASNVGEKVRDLGENARESVQNLGEKARERMHDVSSYAKDIGHRASERVQEIGSYARERAHDVSEKVQHRARQAGDWFNHTADDYPLAVASAFFAIGVAAGLSIPATRPERRVIGPVREKIVKRAKEAGREVLERGETVVNRAVDAASEALTEKSEVGGSSSRSGSSSATGSPGRIDTKNRMQELQHDPTKPIL